jgi:predicted AAA+ superfamily ATPase
MIRRFLHARLTHLAARYPVVVLSGPRQAGKTTLCRAAFPDYPYISLETPDHRAFAMEDPRGFLKQFPDGVILDEVQRNPDLLSYIQTQVDSTARPGQFILTGSQNLLLSEKISQSLAGRSAILNLLPFAKRELFAEPAWHPDSFPESDLESANSHSLWSIVHSGFYPRIHDQQLDAHEWLASYFQTYVERDVRLLINIGDLETYGRFLRLCAGRAGQLLNYSALAADAGISHMTAKRWLSILQSSYIIALVVPHHENFNKRLVKSPKLYFLDTGLLTYLLGIRQSHEIAFHRHKGAIFENFVFVEMYKSFVNSGLRPDLYFWRDRKNHEIDFLLLREDKVIPIEVKAGETISRDQFTGLQYFYHLTGDRCLHPTLIYAGDENYQREGIRVMSWRQL